MRIITIFLLLSFSLFGQSSSFSGQIKFREDNSPVPQGILKLTKENTVKESVTDIDGYFKFQNLENGIYVFTVDFLGFPSMSLNVNIDGHESKQILFPAPCEISIKKCPENHIDEIIPIVYGFPSSKIMKKAEKGKIHLGGCNVTGCDPKWFCKKHNKSF